MPDTPRSLFDRLCQPGAAQADWDRLVAIYAPFLRGVLLLSADGRFALCSVFRLETHLLRLPAPMTKKGKAETIPPAQGGASGASAPGGVGRTGE